MFQLIQEMGARTNSLELFKMFNFIWTNIETSSLPSQTLIFLESTGATSGLFRFLVTVLQILACGSPFATFNF